MERMAAFAAGQPRAVDSIERGRRRTRVTSEYGAEAEVDDHR
jgi:hypothetical protein